MNETLAAQPPQLTTTEAVFSHHLAAFAEGLDAIVSDYADDSVIMTPERAYHGLSEIRGFFEAFLAGAPAGLWEAFSISAQTVDRDVAYLVWSAHPWVPFATDTFVIRDGKIRHQTFASVTP